MKKDNMSNEKLAMRVSEVSIAGNVVLSVVKLLAGIFGNSAAMISDAVHSLSDVLSTFIVIAGIKISNKRADVDHRYGHERFECIASIILATMLAVVGLGIGISGIKAVAGFKGTSAVIPSPLALAAAAASIIVKEAMFWYGRNAALKINSDALMADAWHHRSDALSSVGALIGIGGAMLGAPLLDPLASVVISLFILKASYDIFKDAADKMVDKACDEETEENMRVLVGKTDGVIAVDLLNTRLFGPKIYVDIEISADKNLRLEDAHKIAQNVHDEIEREFPLVKHCMVHINPS